MATLVPGEKARMFALGKIMRGGASRGGYVDGRVYVTIGGLPIGWGSNRPLGTIISSLTIQQQLDEVADTCDLRVNAGIPAVGSELVVALGSTNGRRLFAGYALTRQQGYAADKPANVQSAMPAVDYTWLLGFAKVTKQYRGVSGTAIIQDLIATYAAANGFKTTSVQADLPALEITFTDEDLPNAITRLMRRLGGHWFCDYVKDIHAWTGEADPYRGAPPTALTPSHPSLADFRATVDQTQPLTRVYVEHQGSRLLSAVNAGETLLPVETIAGITAAPDTFLKLSYTGAEGGAQHLDFGGAEAGGVGTLVGPGQSPSGGPWPLTLAAGGAVDLGGHGYAFTWVTASGETKPSPANWIDVPPGIATPTVAPSLLQGFGTVKPPSLGGPPCWKPGDYVEWAYSYAFTAPFGVHPAANNATPLSPVTGIVAQTSPYHWVTPGDSAKSIQVQVPYSNDAACGRLFYLHRVNGGQWWIWDYNNGRVNVPGGGYPSSFDAMAADTGLTSAPIPTATPSRRAVQVDGIATGPATVTGRKLYRTKGNQAAPFQLVTTLANNTATTYTDAAADATLGATAPASDTSGLQQPTGNINAGSPTIIVASTAPFRAAGGWAIIAGQEVVRYTGIGAGSITGLPATGPGSLAGPIAYNTPIAAAPILTGIPTTGARSISADGLAEGHEVYCVVQVDDPNAQATLAARLGVADGKREEWIADRRLSYQEAKARGQATLQVRPLDATSISYRCRDLATAVGKTITVNLPAPTSVTGTFRIQHVTISNFRPHPTQYPTFSVEASSVRFTFEDWLRIIKTRE
jgi:hypothetical protein